ncbi:MAG TPA: CRISPR-associated protein Cas5 [bacterium]|nr:CRISPR-associated protein Cas5 [bacterium]HOL35589.1 CRISPR-associated protein Cas5 [bacterium]HPP08964.1 CRISPR-associated protein Cas5 [bacterium]
MPFTWQSALTYPVLPPSAVIGMLANAFQRYKNAQHPIEYLKEIENKIFWAGSRLLTPCVVKSYITSAITKWGDTIGTGKFTNALSRQFAYTRNLQVSAIFNNDEIVSAISDAIVSSPLFCGDSESPISLDDKVMIKNVMDSSSGKTIYTEYPVPFTPDTKIEEGNGIVYLMHERCLVKRDSFPLQGYIVPIREEEKLLKPSYLRVKITNEKVFQIENIGYIIVSDAGERLQKEATKQTKKRGLFPK